MRSRQGTESIPLGENASSPARFAHEMTGSPPDALTARRAPETRSVQESHADSNACVGQAVMQAPQCVHDS